MTRRKLALAAVLTAIGGSAAFVATPFGRDLMFHVLPLRWTGEPERLARALAIGPGSTIADIGAGNGALAIELSRIVGANGQALATERTEEQRQRIAERARASGTTVTVVAAADAATNLPDACCDAVTMRFVMHHIADLPAFARDLRRTLRPGGRAAIIDFAPGAMPHLAAAHGVDQDAVTAAFKEAGFTRSMRDDQWGGRSYLIVFTAPG
jgi:ubiquinone/menaquinone biosynthesis C-methylase UbiE